MNRSSSQQKDTIVIMVFLLLLFSIGGFYFFFTIPAQSELRVLESKIKNAEKTLNIISNRIKDISQLEGRRDNSLVQLESYRKIIPRGIDLAELIERLSIIADASGGKLKASKTGMLMEKTTHIEVPLLIEFQGNYRQCMGFLVLIIRNFYSFDLQELSINGIDGVGTLPQNDALVLLHLHLKGMLYFAKDLRPGTWMAVETKNGAFEELKALSDPFSLPGPLLAAQREALNAKLFEEQRKLADIALTGVILTDKHFAIVRTGNTSHIVQEGETFNALGFELLVKEVTTDGVSLIWNNHEYLLLFSTS